LKKVLSVLLTLCLFVNVSFAFDPYADEEIEKKSYKKLYYGIVLTLLGGFLAYDGFSLEKVDTSRPSVDYTTVLHSEYVQRPRSEHESPVYEMRSGISLDNVYGQTGKYRWYEIEDTLYKQIEPNILYNNGNVDLENLTIEVRYRYQDGTYMGQNGEHVTYEGYYIDEKTHERVYVENQGYHIAQTNESEGSEEEPVETKIYGGEGNYITLKKGDYITWQDIWGYTTVITSPPRGEQRSPYTKDLDTPSTPSDDNDDNEEGEEEPQQDKTGSKGLNLGKNALILMDIRVKLDKNLQYKPIYQTKHKSDAEGVAGILVGITGIYFIIDHFLDMHKFNAYAKRHHLNLKFATASNEYKLLLQKRI